MNKPTFERDLDRAAELTFGLLLGICMYLVATFLCGAAIMYAWNCSMPYLFFLPRASLGNGVGLAVLASVVRGTQIRPIGVEDY